MNVGPTELIIVLIIVLLIFGGSQLPKLARSLGQAKSEFEKGVTEKPSKSEESDSAS